MNWSRGFFRAWVLLSVLWTLGMVVLFQPWDHVATIIAPPSPKEFAIGDVLRAELSPEQPLSLPTAEDGQQLRAFRVFTVEGRTEEFVAPTERAAIAAYAELQTARWVAQAQAQERRVRNELVSFALFSLLPVLVLLAFGLAARWVVRGFKGKA